MKKIIILINLFVATSGYIAFSQVGGVLDSSFGTNGIVTTPNGSTHEGHMK